MLSLTRIATRNLAQIKNYHTGTSPPKCRVGLPYKAVHMALFVGTMLSVPIYICVNFKNYRGDE